MTPFLKWPGGKRWFVANYAELLPEKYNRYIEPFLGGGSVFFHLKPSRAILSDLNTELTATYKAIRDNWEAVNKRLAVHHSKHDKLYFYSIRSSQPRSTVNKAARLIYLNRTCFNGIYRVNLNGKFNVPKGTKSSVILETDDFQSMSRLLADADIRNSDFETVINDAAKNDLIFVDPPYTVRHNINGFIKYNENLFSWSDQVRLADALASARDRGANIVSTNANHQSLRDLYRERGFIFKTVSRFSSISADAKSRKQFEELIIRT